LSLAACFTLFARFDYEFVVFSQQILALSGIVIGGVFRCSPVDQVPKATPSPGRRLAAG
jgi:hypothetical protein